jgi:hypothetical protein
MKPLVLRSLPAGGVLCRVSAPDEAAVEWLNRQRDRWWTNARHYCGDALVIEEEGSPKRRKASTKLDEPPQV